MPETGDRRPHSRAYWRLQSANLWVLKLPRSSYYQSAKPTPTQLQDEQLSQLISKVFRAHRGRYGYRRIGAELNNKGVTCSASRVRRLMRASNLRAKQARGFCPRTSDGLAEAPAPNRPVPEAIDQVWTGDITYIPSQTGWLYLAFVMDLCSRRIIGWSLASHMRADLVVSALDQALQTRDPNPETIFRSDLGSQYGSHALRDRLGAADIQQSMSARANPYDNAFTESFIGTLKAELIEGTDFTGEQDARLEVFDYIEGYYNTQRSHSSLGCRSPSAFERALHE